MYKVYSNGRIVGMFTNKQDADNVAESYRKHGTTLVTDEHAPAPPVEEEAVVVKLAYDDITCRQLRELLPGVKGQKKTLYNKYLES